MFLAILANSSVYNLQRIRDIFLTPDLFSLSAYLYVGKRMLTTLFQFPTFCSALLSILLQIKALSKITLSSNLCNFYTLSLNNLAKPSANVPSVIVIKYAILANLSQTTRITLFPATNSNFIMKSTAKCVHSLSKTSFVINLPTSASV